MLAVLVALSQSTVAPRKSPKKRRGTRVRSLEIVAAASKVMVLVVPFALMTVTWVLSIAIIARLPSGWYRVAARFAASHEMSAPRASAMARIGTRVLPSTISGGASIDRGVLFTNMVIVVGCCIG